MIFSANKQRFTQMDVNPFRTEERMFSFDFEEYQVSLWPEEQNLSSVHTLHRRLTYLWGSVCASEDVWSQTRSALTGLRLHSSQGEFHLCSSEVTALSQTLPKTREQYFKADLPAKRDSLAILSELLNLWCPFKFMKHAANITAGYNKPFPLVPFRRRYRTTTSTTRQVSPTGHHPNEHLNVNNNAIVCTSKWM